jgi:hypothetical protein
MKLHFIIIISIFQLGVCQFSPVIENQNPIGSTNIGAQLFNSEKLKIQQGFTFGTSLMENQSTSYGMFSNNFQYSIKSNLQMTGGVHFLQKSGNIPGPIPNQNFDVLYDLNLKYQPWENAWIQFSVSNFGLNKRQNIFNP